MLTTLKWIGELPGTHRGIGLFVLAGLMATVMMALIRLLGADLHPFEINFIRSIFCLLMLTLACPRLVVQRLS